MTETNTMPMPRIPSNLAEDIRHFVLCKCTLQIDRILHNADKVLNRVIEYIKDHHLDKTNKKYNRKMILPAYKYVNENGDDYEKDYGPDSEYECYNENDYNFIETTETCSLEEYMGSLQHSYAFDSLGGTWRYNCYGLFLERFQLHYPEQMPSEHYAYTLLAYRILHNLVCMLEPNDRAAIMCYIDHYCQKIMPFYDDEENVYDDDYDSNGYDSN